MEIYKITNLSFTYPQKDRKAVNGITLAVQKGEFITLCGKSGCGKTTLLRLLKPIISPHGEMSGEILFSGKEITEIPQKEQAERIGFVMQNPENQIVTDKVWHELSFGLESLGLKTPEIRARVSEMASFFGIQNWFYKKTDELSGGQKQMLNLASVMVMQPEVLILDEPTAMLDPIAAGKFLQTLKKINTEFGTTVILAEHRMEEAVAISDRIIVMDNGAVIADSSPDKIGGILKKVGSCMYDAMPTPIRVFESTEGIGKCPVTIREGKDWLFDFAENHPINRDIKSDREEHTGKPLIEVNEVFFRYEKNAPDVIKNLNISLYEGEFLAVLGGNGTGKTTAISLISGINTPQRGEILIKGKKLKEIKDIYGNLLGVLPQEPKSLFAKKTVFEELMDMTDKKMSEKEREIEVSKTAHLCRIEDVLENHPYDLSGGEQERTALAMILIKKPQILIMDEPTKGMDAHFKKIFAQILNDLRRGGASILMVSHDLEFCAKFADRCALFFDGAVTSEGFSREFFTKNCFYTTSANRMARDIIPDAVLAEDIISAIGGRCEKNEEKHIDYKPIRPEEKPIAPPKNNLLKGIFFVLVFAVLYALKIFGSFSFNGAEYIFGGLSVVFLWLGLNFILPQKELGTAGNVIPERKLKKRTLLSVISIVLVIPLTIFFGVYYLGDRKYYFISLLIVLETLLPFFAMFENRRAEAREIVLISVLCALGVAGRIVFFMIPEFKPLLAIIILSGICLGGEAGFLIGAMTGFVSNFFFGQGTWTQWQMFALGIVGFFGGILFQKEILPKTKVSISAYGFFSALIIYGGIMNPASVLMVTANPTKEMIYSAFLMGIPIDLIHAVSTSFFLWFLSEPFIEKLERIKTKYGLLE